MMLLLDDPAALHGFLGLIATRRMPVQEMDLLNLDGGAYRINVTPHERMRTPDWRILGPVNDPLAALMELFHHPDSRRLRTAVMETWRQEQAKLVVDCGGDQQRARDLLQLAMRDMELPEGSTNKRFAADVALLAKLNAL
ncbi:MAG: hypothetical protein ACRDRG_03755 [Pseudonocardiaceae bacterium]